MKYIDAQTWPDISEKIVIASDGTFWTAGYLLDDEDFMHVVHNVIRKYGRTGIAVTFSYMLAPDDHVGSYADGNEYFEFSLDGSQVDRYDGPGCAGTFTGRRHRTGVESFALKLRPEYADPRTDERQGVSVDQFPSRLRLRGR